MQPQEMVDGIDRSLADLAQRLAAVEQEKLALAAAMEGLKEARSRLVVLQPGAGATVAAQPPVVRPDTARSAHRQTVIDILRRAGRPLTAAEIAKEINGQSPSTSLKSHRDMVHSVLRRAENLFRRSVQGGAVLWQLRGDQATETRQTSAGQQVAGKPADSDRPHGRNGAHGTVAGHRAAEREDLAGKTIPEAAEIILAEHGNVPLYYREIAEEAERRGYSSGRSAHVPPSSFSVMLHRRSDIFEKMGEGKYRLREKAEASRS